MVKQSPGDPPGAVGEEEDGGVGDLGRGTESLEGDPFAHLLLERGVRHEPAERASAGTGPGAMALTRMP